MEKLSSEKAEIMSDIMKRIEDVMAIIDSFEISRPGLMVFTKLDEAILWSQVLVSKIALKKSHDSAPISESFSVDAA